MTLVNDMLIEEIEKIKAVISEIELDLNSYIRKQEPFVFLAGICTVCHTYTDVLQNIRLKTETKIKQFSIAINVHIKIEVSCIKDPKTIIPITPDYNLSYYDNLNVLKRELKTSLYNNFLHHKVIIFDY